MIIQDPTVSESTPRPIQRHVPQLRFWDGVIFRLLDLNCLIRGYSVRLAATAADHEEHRRLVQDNFFEQGHYRDRSTPLKPEPPGSTSWIWIARYKGKPVGTLRLIHNPAVWPMDLTFPARMPAELQREHAAEIGRFNIDPHHRRRRWVVAFALLRAAFGLSCKRGIRWWTGSASAHLILGFMHYSSAIQFLESLPLDASHLAERVGREDYFAERQRIRAFAIDLCQISITSIACKAIRKRLREGHIFRYRTSKVQRRNT